MALTAATINLAAAEVVTLGAKLSTEAQVPPIKGNGTGNAEITFDSASRKLSWKVVYSGLSATPTAAHFHGAASSASTAPVIVPMPGAEKSPIEGAATLTEAQAADMLAGKWYINIHTATYPGGEIRGMVEKK
jgi:hypothetical protein